MPITEEDRAKAHETARQMASHAAAEVSDADMSQYAAAARSTSEGLLELTNDPEIAAHVSMAFSRLLDMLGALPLNSVGKVLNDTVIAYALGAGHLTGTYQLPAADEQDATVDGPPSAALPVQDELPLSWDGSGRYL